jgi:hypothetical protein
MSQSSAEFAQSSKEFEVALRAHLHSKFLQSLPPHFLKLRVHEFLQLTSLQLKATQQLIRGNLLGRLRGRLLDAQQDKEQCRLRFQV